MRKKVDENKLFERILNIYIDDNFSRKSVYFDKKIKEEFDYKRITEYLENYFRRNIVDEEKIILYHEKRRKNDFSYVDILKYKNAFYEFINGNYDHIKNALTYIEKYADKNELENYKKALINYREKFKCEFETFENNNFIDSISHPIHEEMPVMLLFREYVKYVLKEDYGIYKRRKSLRTSKCYVLLSRILESDDLEALAQKIYEQNLTISIDVSKTYDFVMTYQEAYKITDEEAEKLENILMKKIQQLRMYIKAINKSFKAEQEKIVTEKYEKQRLDLCNKLVTEYINSEFTSMKMFCKKGGISYDRFKADTLIVKKYNPELYKKFAAIVKKQQAQRYLIITNMLNDIAYKLINGVQVDSENKRAFDIIDYYLITNISFEQLLTFAKKILDGEELRLVRKFIKKYHFGSAIIKKDILEERNVIILNGSQYEVTNEDKNYVFSYLEKNNIPLLASTYATALKRYLNNDLPELKNQEKCKIKK